MIRFIRFFFDYRTREQALSDYVGQEFKSVQSAEEFAQMIVQDLSNRQLARLVGRGAYRRRQQIAVASRYASAARGIAYSRRPRAHVRSRFVLWCALRGVLSSGGHFGAQVSFAR
jgi:hypothetical protein